jgi:YD repeat-containing protein
MVDGTGTTTYTYDELGRLLSVTSPVSPSNKTVGYRYDR